MGNRKKDKRLILQRIRMRAALRVKRRHISKVSKNSKIKIQRIKNSIDKTIRTPRKYRRINYSINNISVKKGNIVSKKNDLINRYLPSNLKYITTHSNSPFNLEVIRKSKNKLMSNGVVQIPECFSILNNTEQSVAVFQKMLSTLFIETPYRVIFDYKECKNIDLSTQVLFDIILTEYNKFTNLKVNKNVSFPKSYGGNNINNDSVAKMMWSVGSPANLGIRKLNFPDVEKLNLQIYDHTKERDENKRIDFL